MNIHKCPKIENTKVERLYLAIPWCYDAPTIFDCTRLTEKLCDAGQVWICGSNMNCGRRKFSAINFSTSSSSCRNRWDGLERSRHHRKYFGFISLFVVQSIRAYGTWDLMPYIDEFVMICTCLHTWYLSLFYTSRFKGLNILHSKVELHTVCKITHCD